VATTTTTAIRIAAEKLLIGTTPQGKPLAGGHRYKLASDHEEFGELSVADANRGIRIDMTGAGEPMSFGTINEAECQDTLRLLIGHAKHRSPKEQADAIAEDVQQIIQVLIKPANLSTGVWRIWPVGHTETEHEKWIETELTFDLTYSLAQV